MIFEIVQHLQNSPLTGRVYTYERDDDKAPFNQATSKPVVVRQQGAPADTYITQASFDIWLFTQQGASHSDTNAILQDGKTLQDWLIQNFEIGRIGNIRVTGTPSGPFRDGQNRRYVTLSITAFRSSGG